MQVTFTVEKPTAQTYFEKNFKDPESKWKDVYTLPRRVMINTDLRIFQYKLLHNILYLNKLLYKFLKRVSHFALFAWNSLKAQFIIFVVVQKQLFYGCSYTILFKTN